MMAGPEHSVPKIKLTAQGLFRMLFINKTNHGLVQLFRYAFVGGFSAIADVGSLFAFTSKFHVFYLVSAALAFVIGTIVNYALSILWVFERSSNFKLEFALFTLVGVGGLGITELIIWVTVSKLGLFYLLGKLIALAVVVVWSFTLRKLLFDKLPKGNALAAAGD